MPRKLNSTAGASPGLYDLGEIVNRMNRHGTQRTVLDLATPQCSDGSSVFALKYADEIFAGKFTRCRHECGYCDSHG